jgi:1,4-alpha-glucan branching enzyme
MGEEYGAQTPFLFFCDFEKELAAAVTTGRRNEFANFARFKDPTLRDQIPDPNAAETFNSSRLDWRSIVQADGRDWLDFYRQLLSLRYEHVVPRLGDACGIRSEYKTHGDRGLTARWKFPDKSELILLANLGSDPLSGLGPLPTKILFASHEIENDLAIDSLPAWSVVWGLQS